MFKRTASVLLMAILLASFFVTPAFAQKIHGKGGNSKTINIAHRGASGYAPENTIAAFRKAVQMRADYFEIDVQMTKDGKLVVIHDTTVDRTTNGTGKVGNLKFDEIRSLDAGSWFAPEYAGEKVPTFGEILDQFRGRTGILIELKSPELYPGIEEKVAKEIKKRNLHHNPHQRIIVQSFNHDSVQKSKSLLPNVPHGVLAGMNWKNVTDVQLQQFATYADYFNPNQNLLTSELVDRIHSKNMKTWPYTARTQEQVDRLLGLGVDGIITDFPDLLQK
ncbi:glycerophosphodiester phosphodiesterase family protein [Aciduricibacillus chroicocephali]|uniref:Glycerophosphodiester phosphodiesterase family protein n=1 Tax=Aciduricibacillus chroicocephali TaxID=3054939 RepID=A0ABY9KX44_9BACI|nr:glycerophosphodiester phosphodiesterase family protein [Bacillaceae bacterium 44XB]